MGKSGGKGGAGRDAGHGDKAGGDKRRSRIPKHASSRYAGRGAQVSRQARQATDSFTCGHCGRFVPSLPSGGHHRNHCPYCLYSRHVDAELSGDRASRCRGLMEPVGAFQRPNGEHVVVHRCQGCGFERFNRIAADDDFDLVLSLPVVPPRSARPEGQRPSPPSNEVPPRDANASGQV